MTKPLTGRDYHEYMLASKSDNRTRAAFQSAVLGLAPPESVILDFGAGTGIDAKAYAGAGHEVWAFDASREMHDYLVQHCRPEIDSGHIHVIDMTYDDLLAQRDVGQVNAITADFAVFNLIDGHERLFAAFDRWLAADGFVLASVINPYCLGGRALRLVVEKPRQLVLYRSLQCGIGRRTVLPVFGSRSRLHRLPSAGLA